MLVEKHLDGYVRDKVAVAIDRLRAFEPPEGYYLAFSGGKDSQTIYHLAIEAGVKFDAHYNVTGIDPPELVRFIKLNYPEVNRHLPKKSFFKLIESKGFPNRWKRWCCAELKEKGGEGRIVVTGVRWAESAARSKRKPFEIMTTKQEEKMLFNDNDKGRRMFESCIKKGKRIVNPIIDWLEEDVWEYLNSRGLPHCSLYDEGMTRIGCIGCPLASYGIRKEELERWPKYKNNYIRAIERWFREYLKRCNIRNAEPALKTVNEWINYWMGHEEDKRIDYTDSFLED
jgi:phosphoadenosine phosphosulfate reductase